MENFFHFEIAKDTYIIIDPLMGPNEDRKSLLPGTATANSYLLVGDEEALLIDLSINKKGIVKYAENVAQKPVKIILSHAHLDHIFHISQCKDVWLHRADETLLRKGQLPFQLPVIKCPKLHYVEDKDVLDLGNRQVEIIHMPGHTDGSILILDYNTKILFSGDTIARRLLYGLHTKVEIEKFVEQLEEVRGMCFEKIYSIHDRCALSKDNIDYMIPIMIGIGQYAEKVEKIPILGNITTRESGDERDLLYFSVAFC